MAAIRVVLLSGTCADCREEARLFDGDVPLAGLRPAPKPLNSLSLRAGMDGYPDAPVFGGPWRLSRFASLRRQRREGEELVLTCPLGFYSLVFLAPAAARFAGLLFAETVLTRERIDQLAEQSGLAAEQREFAAEQSDRSSDTAARILLDWLCAMNALEPVGTEENADMAHWEWHDLAFHAQSRPERRQGRVRPYRWRGKWEPLPVFKPVLSSPERFIALPEPQMSGVQTSKPQQTEPQISRAQMSGLQSFEPRPFLDVLAARRSCRAFSANPLPLDTLAAFLRYSAGVQEWRDDELGGISFRPSPSAGALHGLEIYLAANACEGLERGLYRYDPLRHGLEIINVPPCEAEKKKTDGAETPGHTPHVPPKDEESALDILLEQARRLCAANRPPQAYLILTARFRRYQWKYGQIAYSVMLKDLGCLHQTMSLTAESLGLGSVIVGDTPAEPFLGMAGLEWTAEGPVGSFLLGHKSVAAPKNERGTLVPSIKSPLKRSIK